MKKRLVVLLIIIALLAVSFVTAMQDSKVETTCYEYQSDLIGGDFDGYKIVQISDFHRSKLSDKAIAAVAEEKPNLIVITGDLIDSGDTDLTTALTFTEQLTKIAPVYFVTGNHEAGSTLFDTLTEKLTALGVTELRNETVTINSGNGCFALTGISDPLFLSGLDYVTPVKGQLNILLSHRPELFESYVDKGYQLVLTGHAHGGQIRVPGIGGLVAPDQGLFPTYDAGLYTEGNTTMVVNRGIGNSILPLRINNPPEIVSVTLKSTAK